MLSVKESILGRPYWFRFGDNIKYYKNHFLRSKVGKGEPNIKTCFPSMNGSVEALFILIGSSTTLLWWAGHPLRLSVSRLLPWFLNYHRRHRHSSSSRSRYVIVNGPIWFPWWFYYLFFYSQGNSRNFFTATFTMQFKHHGDICYLAYHYPYSHSRLLTDLTRLQIRATQHASSATGMYLRVQKLTSTLLDNPVPVVTITQKEQQVDMRTSFFFKLQAKSHSAFLAYNAFHGYYRSSASLISFNFLGK